MTPEEVYQIWAPAESIWSKWAIPVPFAQMICVDGLIPVERTAVELIADGFEPTSELAIVVDLPGAEGIRLGLALAKRGFQPVPVIDGSPGPGPSGFAGGWVDKTKASDKDSAVAVDMRATIRALCQGAFLLRDLRIMPTASPVFLLDSMRAADGIAIGVEVFDNRWKTFPQDFPSARFLMAQGIRRLVLIQSSDGQPQEDLSHVLLRWQEAGIRLQVFGSKEGGAVRELSVNRPTYFRALWQRALAMIGLRRGQAGGFGNWPHGTGEG